MHAVRVRVGWRMLWAAFAVLLVGVFVVPAPGAAAASIDVTRFDDPVPDGCETNGCSLREAILAANASPGEDDIQLPAGTFTLTGLESGLLEVTDPGGLFVVGAGAGQTIITREPDTLGFFRVLAGAEFHLEGVSVVGFGADRFSVGVWNEGGEVTIADTELTGHGPSIRGGGVLNDSGVAFVTRTTISGGTVGFGGAVYNGSGYLQLVDSALVDNHAVEGGGIYNDTGTVDVTGGSITGNYGSDAGGGIYNKDGTVTLTGTAISDNAGQGIPVGQGGGIYNAAILRMHGGSVSGHIAYSGGGVYNAGLLELDSGASVTGNAGLDIGGGILNTVAATLESVDVSSNTSGDEVRDGFGGGIVNLETMSLTNSSVRNNVSVGGSGGGIVNGGDLSVEASTISGNRATGFAGGGIMDFSGITLVNSTVSGNSASAFGGGLWLDSQAVLTHVTITGNEAFQGGGLYSESAGVMLTGTMIAANSAAHAGPDCSGAPASAGHNLLGTDDGCTLTPIDPTDVIGTPGTPIDPRLGPLAHNGGPTATHAVLPGSPAVDAIPSVVCAVTEDQRGTSRPQNTHCDIGAFEAEPNLAPVADAGPDQILEATRPDTAAVLDGTGSFDANGDPLTYSWTGSFIGGSVSGPTPTVGFAALGAHEVTLTVSDGAAFGASTVLVTVADTTAPTASAALVAAGKVGPNDGTFTIASSCTDTFDVGPTVTADVNGVPVVDGQIVKLKWAKDFAVKRVRDGQLFLLGPEFVLTVACVDASDNEGFAVAEHVFRS